MRNHWQLIALTGIIYMLWQTPIVQPLRILIVFLHELSHAGATLVTGGKVIEFAIFSNESGHVLSQGGNRFLTLTAGYLGSLVIGVILFLISVRTTWDRWLLGILGALLLLTTALYIRDSFALVFCAGTGAAMLLSARLLPANICDLILRIIGVTSIIYVPFDIFSDTIKHTHLRSDAFMMAQEFGGTTAMWGGIWLIASILTIASCARLGLGENSNITFKNPFSNKT